MAVPNATYEKSHPGPTPGPNSGEAAYTRQVNRAIDKANKSYANVELNKAIVASVQSVCKAVVAELPTVSLTKVAAAMAAQSARALPNALRSRTATQYTNERGNKPATFIEVARMPTGGSGTARDAESIPVKFNDFFITDCQEQDAEKAEVAETFGTPHVFASGRYMRKVSIQGVCRTGPINPEVVELTTIGGVKLLSDEDYARYLVPQTLGLRVLYDKLLRASELISRGMFARLHVDGEVYSGWFITLNIARNSNEEAFAHFTSSMLVFSRYHKDEIWAEKLVPSNLVGKRGALTDTTAAAVLADMVGKMDLKFSASLATISGTITEATSGTRQFKNVVSISATGIGQNIQCDVTMDGKQIDGFRLMYQPDGGSSVYLAGSYIPGGRTYPLVPFVSNFEALRDAIVGSAEASAQEEVQATIHVVAKPTVGASAEMDILLTLNTLRELKIEVISINGVDGASSSIRPAKDVFPSTNTMQGQIKVSVGLKSGVPLESLNAIVLASDAIVVGPDDSPNGRGLKVSGGGSQVSVKDQDLINAAPPVVDPPFIPFIADPYNAGTYLVVVDLKFDRLAQRAGVTKLGTENPFETARQLAADFRLQVTPQGYAKSTSGRITLAATYESWLTNALGSTFTLVSVSNQIILQFPTNAPLATYPMSTRESAEALKSLLLQATLVFDAGSLSIDLRKANESLKMAKVTPVADGVRISVSSTFLSATSFDARTFGVTSTGGDVLPYVNSITFKLKPSLSAQSPTYTKR